MAFDPALVTLVLQALIASVSGWLRRRARRLGIRGMLKTGAVTEIQRFNSALDVSVHFHALVLDGVYSFPAGKKPVFHPTPSPSDEDVATVAARIWRRVERRLASYQQRASDRRFAEEAPLLLALAEASAAGVVATGPRRGCRVVRVRGPAADVDAVLLGKLCAQVEGYNLQAATRLAANDRGGLERMCRYLARPPIATDRLSRREDGRLELRLKRVWRDGTRGFSFTPHRAPGKAGCPGASAPGASDPLSRGAGARVWTAQRNRARRRRNGRGGGPAPARTGRSPATTGAGTVPVGVAVVARVPDRCIGLPDVRRSDARPRRRHFEIGGDTIPEPRWASDRAPALPSTAASAPARATVWRWRLRFGGSGLPDGRAGHGHRNGRRELTKIPRATQLRVGRQTSTRETQGSLFSPPQRGLQGVEVDGTPL